MKKLLLLSLVCVLSLSLLTFIASADDSEDEEKKPYKGSIFVGGIFSDADEEDYVNTNALTGGRVAEYGIAESAAILGFDLSYLPENGDYVFADALVYDQDNALASLTANWGRMVGVTFDYRRFVHRLDNDNLGDWEDSYITFDDNTLEQEMIMRYQVLNSGVKFTPSSFPGASFFAHVRLIGREGDMQTRTLNDHCFNCHMTTDTMNFDTQTLETVVGAEYAKEGFSARYNFKYRSLGVDNEEVTVEVSRVGFHPWLWNDDDDIVSVLETPENNFISNSGEVRFDVGTQFSVYGKGRIGELENDNTGYTQDKNFWVGRANFYATDKLRFKGLFQYYEIDSEVPSEYADNDLINGFGFNRTRIAGTAIYRPIKALKLEGTYSYEDWEREGTNIAEESEVTSFKLKALYRPNRKFRVSGSWKTVDRENPIGAPVKDHGIQLDGIFQAFQGTDEDHFKVFALYTPDEKVTLSFNMNYVDETGTEIPDNSLNRVDPGDVGNLDFGPTTTPEIYITFNDSLDLESTRLNMNFSGNFMIDDKNGLYANYYYFDNSWERDVYLGTQSSRFNYFFLDDYRPMEWESTGSTLNVGGWFALNKVYLYPSWSWIDVESGYNHGPFETSALDANTNEITVNRVKLKASVPINQKLWVTAMYYLDKYEEDFLPNGNGEINYFAAWLKWKF